MVGSADPRAGKLTDIRFLLKTLPLCCGVLPQICSTLLPYPGDVMDRKMGSSQIPASSISFANTFGVLFTVVFYDLVVVPVTDK